MFINEVEHLVGLSKKSIRYYEENGLLTPRRNHDNDYRIYEEEDIEKLKRIKFLRELDVPIQDLKKLNQGEISLTDCMEDRIYKISQEEKNYSKIKKMCEEIKTSSATFENIDINKYFQDINILNKEGFTMRKNRSSKTKKIVGAITSSLIFSTFFLALAGIISYFQITGTDNLPWPLYGFFIAIFLLPLSGIVYNLIIRIKEIKGGEEDEASKY